MEKYIAFGLYRKNEHGGHQEAMEPGEAKQVYLAADVDKLRELLSRAVELFQDECDAVSEPDSYRWLQEALRLMVRESQ